ncbi:hypothetical protein SAMN05216323_10898 [Williamwhitmania taraxaci]|uniref:Uncharacterized protein n=1 Tax=Williamwhitmania taraxaci TaxID=1640674 RepID=A0A1G6S9V4_9BACT|nr:hypothetical protein SAMN05216323_10898 [Williamwhitmania taraxaci]
MQVEAAMLLPVQPIGDSNCTLQQFKTNMGVTFIAALVTIAKKTLGWLFACYCKNLSLQYRISLRHYILKGFSVKSLECNSVFCVGVSKPPQHG